MHSIGQRTLGFTIVLALGTLAFSGLEQTEAATPEPLKFGMDVGSVDALTTAGLKPDYAMLWVGVWTQKSGWGGTDAALNRLYTAGVTPVVQFYYWGDDISRACLENGCWSTLHGAQKDKTGWQRLAQDLAAHLNTHMKGKPVVIVLESEFNKNDAGNYEPLDGYLSGKAGYLRWAYPAAQVVLGFGNWADWNWSIFDRAAGTVQLVGIQGMRASTRDSLASYQGLVSSLLNSVTKLSTTFGKKVLITDLAFSSYPEPDWLFHQKAAVQSFMDRRDEMQAAGAVGVLYRSFLDTPNMSTQNYYGEAERHFGLAWAANKTWKPAMKVWSDGIKAERAVPLPAVTLNVEVEKFAQKSTGGLSSSSSASGGAFWNLWSNGFVSQVVETATGPHEIRVRAAGMLLDGVGPAMRVEVDGVQVWYGGVLGLPFRDYVSEPTLTAGPHTLKIHFLNDASGNGEDRNLFLDKVTVTRAS